jgi:hypothetical protein
LLRAVVHGALRWRARALRRPVWASLRCAAWYCLNISIDSDTCGCRKAVAVGTRIVTACGARYQAVSLRGATAVFTTQNGCLFSYAGGAHRK